MKILLCIPIDDSIKIVHYIEPDYGPSIAIYIYGPEDWCLLEVRTFRYDVARSDRSE